MTCIPTRSSTGRIDCWPRRLTCSAASRDQTLMRRMGITAATPQAEHEQTSAGALDLPVPAAHAGDHALESRLGDGHQLHPDGAWLRLSGRRDRLAQPTRAGLASVDLDGHGVLYRGRRRRRSPSTASRRSSTPTGAVNLGSGNRRNIDFYNMRRPHSGHRARTPDVVHFATLPRAGPDDLNGFRGFASGRCAARLLRPKAEAAMRSTPRAGFELDGSSAAGTCCRR